MTERIPFLRPKLVKKETYSSYLSQIDESRLYSNYGPLNSLFEQKMLARLFNGAGALTTVSNATLGLMLAISLLRRPKGQYAVMPSFTFAATPQAALWCGLKPYFVDIDPKTWCVDQNTLAKTLSELGDDVAVVVPYATFGTGTDLSYFTQLHNEGTPVVIDAASSLGTTENGRHYGQDFPGAVIYSLHATKAFPVGEGGVVYSADAAFITKTRQAANFGFSEPRESTFLGLNAKLSEYQAAIGLATLDEFDQKKAARQKIHSWYRDAFSKEKLEQKGWGFQQTTGSLAYQFIPVLCPPTTNNIDVLARLAAANIEARNYFRPSCHQQAYFRSCLRATMKVTETVTERIVSLPLWEDMEQRHVERIVGALK